MSLTIPENQANKLILVKHSLPEIDPKGIAHEWHLSEEGRQRCIPLAERLARYQPGVIACSQEPKAVETARIIARQLGRPIVPFPGLEEHARRKVPFTDQEVFEEAVRRFFEQPKDLVFGEETADQAHQRFSEAVLRLVEQRPGESLAIVSHGTVISLFVSRLSGIEPFPLWKRLGLPSFVVLSLPGLALLDITDHVEPLPPNP